MKTSYEQRIFQELEIGNKKSFSDEVQKLMDEESIDEVYYRITNGDIENPFSKNFVFNYIGNTGPYDDYWEYDGEIVNAIDEDMAWDIFLNMSGEYGCPSSNDYSCEETALKNPPVLSDIDWTKPIDEL